MSNPAPLANRPDDRDAAGPANRAGTTDLSEGAGGNNAGGAPQPPGRSVVQGLARTAGRSSLPEPTRVQRAQVETAARALADGAAGELPQPWPGLARSAALAEQDALPARLEAAVSGTDLRLRTPRWWRLAGLLQVLLAVLALAGGLWLLALAGLGYLQLGDAIPTPELEGFAVPTLLLVGGVLAGLVLAFVAGLAIRAGARRRARVAERALRARVEAVGAEHVIAPVEAELAAHKQLCAALAAAQPGARRRARVPVGA